MGLESSGAIWTGDLDIGVVISIWLVSIIITSVMVLGRKQQKIWAVFSKKGILKTLGVHRTEQEAGAGGGGCPG